MVQVRRGTPSYLGYDRKSSPTVCYYPLSTPPIAHPIKANSQSQHPNFFHSNMLSTSAAACLHLLDMPSLPVLT